MILLLLPSPIVMSDEKYHNARTFYVIRCFEIVKIFLHPFSFQKKDYSKNSSGERHDFEKLFRSK